MVVSLINPNILQPNVGVAPLEGQDLNRFFQIWLVGLSGLDPTFVRPERQDEPPNIPDAGQAWCSFSWERITSDTFPFIGFKTSGGNTFRDLQRHELLVLNADFLDLGTNGLSSFYTALVRDNLVIDDNIAYLQASGFNLRSAADIEILPVIFKSRWKYRERLPIYIKRNLERQYNTLQTQQASVAINLDGLFVTGFPNSVIPPFVPGALPFTPPSITGLTLWFDGSDPATIIFSTNPFIARWRDKSSNINDAIQPTGSLQPTQDVGALNSLNTVNFNPGNSNSFVLTNSLSLTSGYTAFAVGKRIGSSTQVCFLGSTNQANTYLPIWNSDTNIYTSGVISRAFSSNEPFTSFNLICTGQNANENSGFIRFNRTDVTNTASDTTTTALMTNVNTIGFTSSTGFTNGDIAEYILYNSVLSLAQIQQVENYLRTKWGTP